MVRLVGERQVLLFRPQPLKREQVEFDAIGPPDEPELEATCIYRHDRLLAKAICSSISPVYHPRHTLSKLPCGEGLRPP